MPDNLAAQVAGRVRDRAREMAKQVAQSIGEPADANKLSRDEIVKLWNLPNPQADPAMVQQLIAAGQHAQAVDMAYPWRNKLIGAGSPTARVQRAEHFARLASGQEVAGDVQP